MGRASYAIALAALLLLAGRLFWSPIALFLISGTSMAPAAEAGDLAVGVATYLKGYRPRDVVVWYSSPVHGVVHRVVRVEEEYVVTKGDGNPAPDPPVPRESVKYVVALFVPREVWLPALAAALAGYGAVKRKRIGPALRGVAPLKIAALAFAALIALDFSCLLLVPVHYRSFEVSLERPAVELRGVRLEEGGSRAVVELVAENAELLGVGSCTVEAGNSSFPCRAYVFEGSSEAKISVDVPIEAYLECYSSGGRTSSIHIVLNSTFDRGWVYGRYRVAVEWRELEVCLLYTSPSPRDRG